MFSLGFVYLCWNAGHCVFIIYAMLAIKKASIFELMMPELRYLVTPYR